MNKFKKSCYLAVISFAMISTSCNQPAPAPQSAKSYKTLTTALGSSSITQTYSAAIRGVQYVDIRPQISGEITQILIKEGAQVKRGETLFVIDQVPYQAAVEVAKANVKSAEAKVATAKLNADSSVELLAEGVISENEQLVTLNTLAEAEAALALARAQEVSALSDLSYTTITSPVDGSAGMIPYHIGSLVSSSISDPLVSVSDNSKMYAYFSMSEAQILKLIREMGSTEAVLKSMPEVSLMLRDGEEYTHMGRIDAISGSIESTTGSVSLRAVFPNPEQMLRNGGSGRVVIKSDYTDVIVVPMVATFEIQDKTFVYRVVDGKAASAQIKVLPYNNGQEYIVLSGINTGEVIIAEGAGLVREGMPIGVTK